MKGGHAVRSRTAVVMLISLAAAAGVVVLTGHLVLRRDAPRPAFGRDLIRVGYAVEAPFAYLDRDGALTGESVEVAREVIRRLGIARTEWVQTAFPDLLDGLSAGRFDVVAAGMFVTADRSRRALFSQPTFRVRQGLLVQPGNPKRLHGYADAARADDVRIAVLSGAIEEHVLLRLGVPRSRIFRVPDARTGWVAVASRNADGLALSVQSIRWMAHAPNASPLETAEPFEQPPDAIAGRLGFGAFAFRLDDHRLRDAWDSVLRSFVGSEAHLRLVAPFGFTGAEMPGRVTIAEIVGP